MFVLDAAFEATSVFLTNLPLCQARLQADARFPWLVLIRAGAAVRAVGEVLGRPVEKLNLGALGNVTPQLHVHVVGRRADDPAWPGPVWGVGAAAAYDAAQLELAVAAAREALGL
jgi:diadenosine tetraphosphate (Ap4A) HIT family hydrolase